MPLFYPVYTLPEGMRKGIDGGFGRGFLKTAFPGLTDPLCTRGDPFSGNGLTFFGSYERGAP